LCIAFYDLGIKRLYIAAGQDGLKIWDVKDLLNPFKLGRYFTPGFAFGVYVLGFFAYIGDFYTELQIYEFYWVKVEENEFKPFSGIKLMNNFVSEEIKLFF